MNAGTEITILDPYEWLPPYGENAISVESQGLELTIKIEYDAEDESHDVCYRELRFKMVCAFYRAAFPGIPALAINYIKSSEQTAPGFLIEYPDSETAQAWQGHWGHARQVRHYKIIFLAENVLFEIFAGSVSLSEELRDVTR